MYDRSQIPPAAMAMTIQQDADPGNSYTVIIGDKYAQGLTWDEMIGFVAYTTCPKGDGWTEKTLFGVMTAEEWAAHDSQFSSNPQVAPDPAQMLLTYERR